MALPSVSSSPFLSLLLPASCTRQTGSLRKHPPGHQEKHTSPEPPKQGCGRRAVPLAKLSWCQRWRQPPSHHSVNTPSISPANHLQQHNCGRQIPGGFITPAPVLPRHSVPTSSQYRSWKDAQRAFPTRPRDFTLCCKTSLRRYILGEPVLILCPE